MSVVLILGVVIFLLVAARLLCLDLMKTNKFASLHRFINAAQISLLVVNVLLLFVWLRFLYLAGNA